MTFSGMKIRHAAYFFIQSTFPVYNPLSFVYRNKDEKNFNQALSSVPYDLLIVRAVGFFIVIPEIRNFLSTER